MRHNIQLSHPTQRSNMVELEEVMCLVHGDIEPMYTYTKYEIKAVLFNNISPSTYVHRIMGMSELSPSLFCTTRNKRAYLDCMYIEI